MGGWHVEFSRIRSTPHAGSEGPAGQKPGLACSVPLGPGLATPPAVSTIATRCGAAVPAAAAAKPRSSAATAAASWVSPTGRPSVSIARCGLTGWRHAYSVFARSAALPLPVEALAEASPSCAACGPASSSRPAAAATSRASESEGKPVCTGLRYSTGSCSAGKMGGGGCQGQEVGRTACARHTNPGEPHG